MVDFRKLFTNFMILEHAKSKETFRTVGKPCGAKWLQSTFMFHQDIPPEFSIFTKVRMRNEDFALLCPGLRFLVIS